MNLNNRIVEIVSILSSIINNCIVISIIVVILSLCIYCLNKYINKKIIKVKYIDVKEIKKVKTNNVKIKKKLLFSQTNQQIFEKAQKEARIKYEKKDGTYYFVHYYKFFWLVDQLQIRTNRQLVILFHKQRDLDSTIDLWNNLMLAYLMEGKLLVSQGLIPTQFIILCLARIEDYEFSQAVYNYLIENEVITPMIGHYIPYHEKNRYVFVVKIYDSNISNSNK